MISHSALGRLLPGMEKIVCYKVKEVAEQLRCSPSNVYDLVRDGHLAALRVGSTKRGIRIIGSDILAFVKSRTTGGPSILDREFAAETSLVEKLRSEG